MKLLLLIVFACFILLECNSPDDNYNDSTLFEAKQLSDEERDYNLTSDKNLLLSKGKEDVNVDNNKHNNNNHNENMTTETEKPKEQGVMMIVARDNNSNNKDDNSNETVPVEKKAKRKRPALGVSYVPDNEVNKIREKYKSYKDLKKSFEKMKRNFHTGTEVVVQSINRFNNITSKARANSQILRNAQVQILSNLNYLTSQIDNAVVFADRGGLEQILLPTIVNSTDVYLRVEAMRVLASMTQNNPYIQVKVFERNFAPYLIQILTSSKNTEELSTSLSAIGSLLRKFPYAQMKLLPKSGIQAIVNLLAEDYEIKVKAKAATILGDLVVETNIEKEKPSDDPLLIAQYESLNYTKWLMDNSFCDIMSTVISNNVHHFWNAPDLLEYFIFSIYYTHGICIKIWSQNAQFRQSLLTLKRHYLNNENEYHKEMADVIDNTMNQIYIDQPRMHDEL